MTSLETYLRGQHQEDNAFLRRLLTTIDEVLPIFCKQKRAATVPNHDKTMVGPIALTTWPYAVTAQSVKSATSDCHFSPSTHCMILFALDAFVGRAKERYSILLGPGFRPAKLSGPTTDRNEVRSGVDAARYDLFAVVKNWDMGDRSEALVKSGTYGCNDPFTLTWLAEIVFRACDDKSKLTADDRRIINNVLLAADLALKRKPPAVLDPAGAEGKFREIVGSFLKVRQLHLAKAADRLAELVGLTAGAVKRVEDTGVWREFDSTVHRQLSYSAMGDPKFDPAELAFALEGALLLHSYWVSRSTVDKVFEALALKERQAYWRPAMPFLANDRGQVLFLVSVEVANSILRSCELLDQGETVPTRFAQIEPQLRTYATWLLGEAERISAPNADGKNLVGWRTEYAEEHGTIHLWHTSHVVLFLAHYESFLKRKIGADGVNVAGLTVRFPGKLKGYWENSEPLRALATPRGEYAVLGRLQTQFIEPRLKHGREQDSPHSVLLYGPPGTGKTTVAEQMAASLGCPLIVITVSDFLAAGSAELENRAKGVFEVLRSQEGVVILFDEIDQFLLDRSSDFYDKQEDVFKFMTPGMLTKLQDLRDDASCVFIIGTNYYERVDSAIKRRGRLDHHLLLCLPDKAQRLALLASFVHKLFKKKLADAKTLEQFKIDAAKSTAQANFFNAVTTPAGFPPGAFADGLKDAKVAEKTVHLGWGDLKGLVEQKTTIASGMTFETLGAALVKAADEIAPAVKLESYRNRFGNKGPYPFEEFFLLAYLIAECDRKFTDSEAEVIIKVLGKVKKSRLKDLAELFKEWGIKDDAVTARLTPVLQPLIKSSIK